MDISVCQGSGRWRMMEGKSARGGGEGGDEVLSPRSGVMCVKAIDDTV